jgi:hypothetical protein
MMNWLGAEVHQSKKFLGLNFTDATNSGGLKAPLIKNGMAAHLEQPAACVAGNGDEVEQ